MPKKSKGSSIVPSVCVTGVRRTISSHSGVSSRPSKVTPASTTITNAAPPGVTFAGDPRPTAGGRQFSLVGRGAGEALVTVHAPWVIATAIAAQANVSVLHPDFCGRESAEQSEVHREHISPAQPGLLAEEGHAVECDQGVNEGEEGDIARHVRTREDVLDPDEQEVESNSGPDTQGFGVGLVELEPVSVAEPADQPFGPIEDNPPGIHQRPQVPDESGKEAEADPPYHPHESRGEIESALQSDQAGDHDDQEECHREQAQAACEQA